METYAYMIMSVIAGLSLLLMPYAIKKIEAFIGFIGSNKNKKIEP